MPVVAYEQPDMVVVVVFGNFMGFIKLSGEDMVFMDILPLVVNF